MAAEAVSIVEYFHRRCGHGRVLHNAACHLIKLILARLGTDRIEEVMVFCADPENLRAWLPTETDRNIFSIGLFEGLRDLASRSESSGLEKRVQSMWTSPN